MSASVFMNLAASLLGAKQMTGELRKSTLDTYGLDHA
jgi:hypothetical protein